MRRIRKTAIEADLRDALVGRGQCPLAFENAPVVDDDQWRCPGSLAGHVVKVIRCDARIRCNGLELPNRRGPGFAQAIIKLEQHADPQHFTHDQQQRC